MWWDCVKGQGIGVLAVRTAGCSQAFLLRKGIGRLLRSVNCSLSISPTGLGPTRVIHLGVLADSFLGQRSGLPNIKFSDLWGKA